MNKYQIKNNLEIKMSHTNKNHTYRTRIIIKIQFNIFNFSKIKINLHLNKKMININKMRYNKMKFNKTKCKYKRKLYKLNNK